MTSARSMAGRQSSRICVDAEHFGADVGVEADLRAGRQAIERAVAGVTRRFAHGQVAAGDVQPACAGEVGRIDVFGRQLAGGGVPPMEEEGAAAVAEVGHKGDAGAVVGQHAHTGGVDAVAGEAVEQAAAKAVVAHRADETGGSTEPRHGIDVDGRVAAGKWPDECARLVERLVQVDAHDFDEHVADGNDLGLRHCLLHVCSAARLFYRAIIPALHIHRQPRRESAMGRGFSLKEPLMFADRLIVSAWISASLRADPRPIRRKPPSALLSCHADML